MKLGTHAFRRGLAVEWLRRGGSEVGLKQVAGWTSTAMVGTYAKASISGLAIEEQRRLFPAEETRPSARRFAGGGEQAMDASFAERARTRSGPERYGLLRRDFGRSGQGFI